MMYQQLQFGVVGMAKITQEPMMGARTEPDAGKPHQQDKIKTMDLSKTYDENMELNKKTLHNFHRVLKNSPARTLVGVGAMTALASAILFITLGNSATTPKQGRDLAALETAEFDYNATGRDKLNQEQVDHIQAQMEAEARQASKQDASYTPAFADAIVAQEAPQDDNLRQTQVSFTGGAAGADYADTSGLGNASFANTVNYGAKPASGGVNYGGGGAGMPQPAAARALPSPQAAAMQQGAGDPNAMNYQDGGYDGGGSGGGFDGGGGAGGAGGPNPTGIDPSIEALRQSLEYDYTQQQQMDEQYRTQNDQRLNEQRQYVQQEIQQRRQATSQALQQQQQNFLQPQPTGFTAATYIPKTSNFNNAASQVWNNNLQSVPNKAAANNQGGGSAMGSGEAEKEREQVKDLSSHIVRVGTTWQVMVENRVNTDNGTTVFARVLSGPYANARLVGQISATGLANRSAGVVFNTLIPARKNKNAIPIQAVGMTIGSLDTHIATSVNRHHLQRYGALIVQGVAGGYGEAYSNASGTTVERVDSNGNVIITNVREKPDSKEIRGRVIGELGGQLQSELQGVRARPTTYVIEQGTPLTIMFTQNMDNKFASTDSISIGGSGGGQGVYSNTSSYGMQPRSR